MFRRQGMEAIMGIGGGIVSAESQKNLELGEDCMRRKQHTEAQGYLLKAMEDPNSLDAILKLSTLTDVKQGLVYLKKAESQGRTMLKILLGENCFDDGGESAGKYWGIVQTLYENALYFSQQWFGNGSLDDDSPSDGAIVFRAPHRNTMKVKKEKNHRNSSGSLLYTAALASFKHFGDCEQSRQYLKLAAIAQPGVLINILAKVKKPADFFNGVLTPNGPEETQDYLIYAHDLWMKPDVWKWANENPDVRSSVLKICSRPECASREIKAAEYKRRPACHLVSYCTVACQKDDWTRHKSACLRHKRDKIADRALMHGEAPSGGAPYNPFSSFVSTPR